MRANRDVVVDAWTKLLGQRALPLSDHTRMAEVIISAIEVMSGRASDTVSGSWSTSTALVVRHAIGGLTVADGGSKKGPRRI
jgi:hypothetical protein